MSGPAFRGWRSRLRRTAALRRGTFITLVREGFGMAKFKPPQIADEFGEKEAQERFEAALKSALSTPHKPLKEKPKEKRPAKKAARAPKRDQLGLL
jgi:hypothetical protein